MNDVVLFRVLVTLLLLLYHSTCFFRGSWEVPDAYIGVDVKTYELIANVSYSLLLEGFTFISGFIYAYQVELKGHYSFMNLVQKKLKRLILPALFWGFIYMLLFNEFQGLNFIDGLLRIFNGVDHLWFLPMLFFCFLFYVLAEKLTNIYVILAFSFFLIIVKSKYLVPFGVGYAFQYLYYFALGVFIYRKSKYIKERMLKSELFITFFLLYVILYILYYYIDFTNISIISKMVHFFELRFLKTFGLIAVYIGINIYTKNRGKLRSVTYSVSALSMGIYIFHHMILDFLYYHTRLPENVNLYILPFVGFIMSLSFSILLTYLGKKIIFLRDVI